MNTQISFKELMKQRYSCRYFLSKPIPEDILKDIIETSLLTPSWGNSQPWSIYVSSGKTHEKIKEEWLRKNNENIKGYSDIEPGHRTDFSERSQKCINSNIERYGKHLNQPDLKVLWVANTKLFNAPAAVYITIPKKRTQYCLFDSGAIEMAVMIAAKEHGIDSIAAYEAIKYPDILRKHLKIPDDEDIVIGISLGYEDKENDLNKYRSQRLNLDEACHFYN